MRLVRLPNGKTVGADADVTSWSHGIGRIWAVSGDIIAVKLAGRTGYVDRGIGNAYSPSRFVVLRIGESDGHGYFYADVLLEIPITLGAWK